MSYEIKLDKTFGVRLKRFLENISTSDAASYDELEALKNYADEIVTTQCLTAKEEDIDYFKRVGVYEEYTKPYLITLDGSTFIANEKAEVYSCMRKPTTGDSVLKMVFNGKDHFKVRGNPDRVYFIGELNCHQYIETNKPKYSENDVKVFIEKIAKLENKQ